MSSMALAVLMAVRGVMAFDYGGPLTPARLAFCGRFNVLVTHDPLPRAQVDALHARGTKLALYEWAVGSYAPIGNAINARPLRGGTASPDIDAWYYDPTNQAERPRRIAARLRAIGYDGVFLDCTTRQNVHPLALAEYERRHPDLPYDAAFARFMAALRREVLLVITNQGYRDAAHYLPFVDYDVTESLITHPQFGLRAQIDFVMRSQIVPIMKKYPRVKFVHLNYTGDSRLVKRIIAIARSYGGDAFVATPAITPIVSDAYFDNNDHP